MIGFCLLLIFIQESNAQGVTIKVKGPDKKGLPGAAVQMIRVSDSSTQSNVTDLSGVAGFTAADNTLYIVKIQYLGFQTKKETILVKPESRSFEFMLKEESVSLGEVSIQAKRPLIRQEEDKMIIDPMPLVNSSTNTLEILEKTPGLYVDQDGGIYLSSTSTAVIYINGRELKMSNQDISTLLRSIPPNSIQQIEVMRTPSTKFDAASSGGIINIVLKKGMKIGRFGSANIGMNQGFYGNQFAGGSFNTSGDKYTFYLNGNYNHNDKVEDIHSSRELMVDTTLFQTVRNREQRHQAFLGYGTNYDFNKKLSLSYDGRLNAGFPKTENKNDNQIDDSHENLLAESHNRINNNSSQLNLQQDLEFTWKIDTGDSRLDTKLSYNLNYNNTNQDYKTTYTSPFSTVIQGEGSNLQKRHFAVIQSDLTFQFPYKIKLESGIKSSYQNYCSTADFYVKNNDSLLPDNKRTNAFNYQEFINAAYIQASKTFGKFLVAKAGVRLEHTYMKGCQNIPFDTSFIFNRADWFPYVYISRKLFKIFGAELKGYLIYRRTINRPGYQNLNPYVSYVDEFLYETGNPALKPQFTNNYEINVSYEDTPIVAFGQNFTQDIITSVVYKDEKQNALAMRTFDNIGKDKETYVRLTIGFPPGKKYFFALGAQYNYNMFEGLYENQPLKYSHESWRLFTFHSLTLWKHTRINLFGFMMINGQQGFYSLKNFGQLNITLSQTLFNDKVSISINARDILHTMVTKFELSQGSINTTGDRYTDNQRFGINIRYNFGMKRKEDKRGFQPYQNEE